MANTGKDMKQENRKRKAKFCVSTIGVGKKSWEKMNWVRKEM